MKRDIVLNSIVQRLFILALLLVLVNTWTATHFGKEPGQFILVHIPIAVLGIMGLFVKYLDNEHKKSVGRKLGNWFLFFLHTPSLVFLWSVFFLAGTFVSSVTINSVDINAGLDASVYALERYNENKKQDPGKISKIGTPLPLICNPFGKPYILKADGYQQLPFELYPWIPKRIQVEKDLTVSPSIFVRIPFKSQHLINSGVVEAYINGRKILSDSLKGKGAILIGRKQEIPGEFLERWNMELRSKIPGEQEAAIFVTLKHWSVDTLHFYHAMTPFDTLNVRLLDGFGKINAESVYFINQKKIQDVNMNIK